MSEYSVKERRGDYGIQRWIVTEAGKTYSHDQCESRLKASVNTMFSWFAWTISSRPTWNEADRRRHELWRLRNVAEKIAAYAELVGQELDRLEGVDHKAQRIAQLREVRGRTPEEAAAFFAKAEQLEGVMNEDAFDVDSPTWKRVD
jgi:hypothetical protein